jgi:hypothetical protein
MMQNPSSKKWPCCYSDDAFIFQLKKSRNVFSLSTRLEPFFFFFRMSRLLYIQECRNIPGPSARRGRLLTDWNCELSLLMFIFIFFLLTQGSTLYVHLAIFPPKSFQAKREREREMRDLMGGPTAARHHSSFSSSSSIACLSAGEELARCFVRM